jgi:hypothetical protein
MHDGHYAVDSIFQIISSNRISTLYVYIYVITSGNGSSSSSSKY